MRVFSQSALFGEGADHRSLPRKPRIDATDIVPEFLVAKTKSECVLRQRVALNTDVITHVLASCDTVVSNDFQKHVGHDAAQYQRMNCLSLGFPNGTRITLSAALLLQRTQEIKSANAFSHPKVPVLLRGRR